MSRLIRARTRWCGKLPRGIRILRADLRALVNGSQALLRAPRRQAEATAAPADPRELAGDGLVVRSEDGAEARRDDVEGRVLVGQVLRIAFVEADRQAIRVRTRLLEERRRDVDADDLRTRPSGTDRNRSGAGGDVEPPLLVDRRQPLGDEAVVPAGPEVCGGQRRVPRTT